MELARYLIVNADDYGLTPGVSRGILKAHRAGILTSTTFMVNLPWAAEMATHLEGVPALGVGIHLNLTTGAPVLPPGAVPSLVDRQGRFRRSPSRLLARLRTGEAEQEWAAQVDRGIQLLGRRPTHLDTHRFLQAYPPLCAAMLAVARRYEIPSVRVLDPAFLPPGEFPWWHPGGVLLRSVLRRSAQLTRGSGRSVADQTLAGDFDLDGLLARLDRVGEGVTELISHPGEVDPLLLELSSLRAQRERELSALTAPQVQERLEARGIRLLHFGQLPSLPG